MSKFLTSAEAVFTPECLLINTFTYIIDELLDVAADSAKLGIPTGYVTDDGVELIGKLWANSNHRLRMYGSARELADNVKIYMNTAGSLRYSDAHGYLLNPYHTTPIVYKSVKSEEYICKPDAYLILQNMTLEAYPFEKPQVLRVLIAIFLRSQELENLKKLEFLKFDQKVFDEINKQIKDVMQHFMTDPSMFYTMMRELSTWEFPKLFRKFKKLIPIEWRDPDSRFFEKVLARYVRENSGAPNFSNLLTILYNTIGETVKSLKRIIDKRADVFKSSQGQITVGATVRLFEDGDQKFVMKAELIDAINRSKKATQKTINYQEMSKDAVETMSMKEALEKCPEILNIEFISTPILRAKHKAVPIRKLTLDYCILAMDAFFETMKTFFYCGQLFQKTAALGEVGWREISALFKAFEAPFRPDEKNLFFVTQTDLEPLLSIRMNMLNFLFLVPAKQIRNAKPDGFSVQNLKNELAYLGLATTFPQIQDFADVVYSEVVKRKKEEILRTCDLFDAIEHCQLLSILNGFPNIKKFVHNQRGCSRVYGYKCDRCESESSRPTTSEVEQKKTSEIEKPSESQNSDQKTEKNRKKKEKKKAKRLEQKIVEKDPGESQKTLESVGMESEESEGLKVTSKAKIDDEKSPEVAPESQKTSEVAIRDSEENKDNETSLNDTKIESESLTSESVIQQKTSEDVKIEEKTPQSFSAALRALKSKIHDQKTSKSAPADPKSIPESHKPSDSESQAQKTSESVACKENTFELSTECPDDSESKNSIQKTTDDPKSVPTSQSSSTSDSANQKTSKKSANCEKCYRTCEMLNETKKELKTMEIKLEKLEKKKASKERELMELATNEEKKMEEKEKEMEMIRNQVLTLESSISEMRIENLRKEETFKERQKHLEEQISNLESELNEEKKKKKTSEFESEILEKNRQIEEFKESEIRWKTENEVNQRMIQQLLDKLASSGNNSSSYSTTNYSNPSGKDSGVVSSMLMTSTSSKSQKCEICWNEMTSQSAIQCQQCRRPFHQKCASNWLKNYKQCPSCNGDFQESTQNHFSSFF